MPRAAARAPRNPTRSRNNSTSKRLAGLYDLNQSPYVRPSRDGAKILFEDVRRLSMRVTVLLVPTNRVYLILVQDSINRYAFTHELRSITGASVSDLNDSIKPSILSILEVSIAGRNLIPVHPLKQYSALVTLPVAQVVSLNNSKL